ncbi:hypothetical protein [Chloracidobacterium thermophilum]|uniref:hypothetical protein n=1 Tax=Chloracidobacterium thermophilum TaxID=458033 RepID=UPI0012FE8996|nr:hypothetical protein [Chloracidobacterium thermophilum]
MTCLTLSSFQKSLSLRHNQRKQIESAITWAVTSQNHHWLLHSARQAFLSRTDGEWLVLEAFRPAVEIVPPAYAQDWMNMLFTRLQNPHHFSGGRECHRLTWLFLDRLAERHPEIWGTFRHTLYQLLSSETDPLVFRAIGMRCHQFPADHALWAKQLVLRTDIQGEPDEQIRAVAWQVLTMLGGEIHPTSVVAEKLHSALTLPGERSPLVISAVMNYLVTSSPRLFFDFWNCVRRRLDPLCEPDWQIRQTVWESLENQNGSLRYHPQMAAQDIIDMRRETHPLVLRQLAVYGQQRRIW